MTSFGGLHRIVPNRAGYPSSGHDASAGGGTDMMRPTASSNGES